MEPKLKDRLKSTGKNFIAALANMLAGIPESMNAAVSGFKHNAARPLWLLGFVVYSMVIIDVLTMGNAKILKYLIAQVKDILMIVPSVVAKNGVETVILFLIIYMLVDKLMSKK